ncbi:MAG: hypothetical protein QM767_30685 [Anaeromyxobacter sp.]
MPTARALATAAALLSLFACSEQRAPQAAASSGPASAAQRYTVRGELLRIEGSGPTRQLWIRHEAIPDFVDGQGRKVGMASMVMPFGIEADVQPAVDGLVPGAKLRFRLAVDWSRNRFALESLEPLPADTHLEFGKAM